MAEIFLSYSRQDAEIAKALASALNERGHRLWWDKQISGGSKFAAEIEQALDSVDIVMVLWSAAAIASPWVLDEAAEGRDTGRLLPIALDNCKPPLGFRQFQTIAAERSRFSAALDDIFEAIDCRGRGRAGAGEQSRTAENRETWCARARHYEDEGRFADAWREIEAALATNPDSAAANREAARFLFMQGRTADAIAYGEKAADSMKNDHESAALLVSCCRSVGDDHALKRAAELAVARAEQAIASAIGVGQAFASGAKGLAALGHRERARKWVRKALNTEPGNMPMRYTVAATLAAFLDEPAAALDVLEPFVECANKRSDLQLLESDPDWSSMRENREFQRLVERARKKIEALEITR